MRPVYFFLGAKEKRALEVMRLPGAGGKEERLTVNFAEAHSDDDPETVFKAGAEHFSLDVKLKCE